VCAGRGGCVHEMGRGRSVCQAGAGDVMLGALIQGFLHEEDRRG
jgi:hypothetical protein